jgi:transposase
MKGFLMAATRKCRKTGTRNRQVRLLVHKPHGAFHPRVQAVGPDHFGVVCIDCAKHRSKLMVADFYGKILLPPTVIEHNRFDLEAGVAQVRAALAKHDIHDCLVVVERTGRYHQIVERAFAAAKFETRLLHPFATKQYRQPADPGNKTDDTDLCAIHRAAVNGFALRQPDWDTSWRNLQLLTRYRRTLVEKSSTLCCQIHVHLDAALPGLAKCFEPIWQSQAVWHLIAQFGSADALLQAGSAGLVDNLRQAGIRFQQRTLDTILAWAKQAAPAEPTAALNRQLALAMNADRLQKAQEITALEQQIAHALAHTPYILLLSIPGVNVVSAAEFAGEMGPIEYYRNARAITGRSGLYPSRYQSDAVDKNGRLVRCCNRRLRAAILGVADNLIRCNQHFRALARCWRLAGKDPRHSHVKIAFRFCRIAYQMVAGRQVFRHPCLQQRHYIIDKLNAFHLEHGTAMAEVLRDLQNAIDQIPVKEHTEEAKPLHEQLQSLNAHKRGPQALRDILPVVLARLGLGSIQSSESGEADLPLLERAREPRTP